MGECEREGTGPDPSRSVPSDLLMAFDTANDMMQAKRALFSTRPRDDSSA